jgi:histone H3/H4
MAKAKKAGKGGSKKSTEIVIVASKMKDAIRGAGCNVAGDAIEHLNERVHTMIQNAVKRAQENGRKTVRGYDF